MARRVILFIHSTLNGVVTGDPDGDKTDFVVWTRETNILGDGSSRLLQLFDRVDTILLGRATYDDLARKWPVMQGPAEAVDVASRLASKINNAPKLVATRDRQLTDLPWGQFAPAEPLTGDDVAGQVAALKSGDAGDLVIFGSPTLVRSLTDAGLIDEYHLVVHPVLVEVGERLFDRLEARTDLHLLSATPIGEDAVLLTYTPAES